MALRRLQRRDPDLDEVRSCFRLFGRERAYSMTSFAPLTELSLAALNDMPPLAETFDPPPVSRGPIAHDKLLLQGLRVCRSAAAAR
jgi:hypothetical protein